MAKLYFRYGSMNSGKSLLLQITAYNYRERGRRAIVAKPTLDTKSKLVLTRAGLTCDVDWALSTDVDILTLFREIEAPVDVIFVDEAQFLTKTQVEQLFTIAVMHNVSVIAYGLRTDFLGKLFEGSRRLMELAHSIEEIKTMCSCGEKAIFNVRTDENGIVAAGDKVLIDDGSVKYESICGKCLIESAPSVLFQE